MRIELCKGDTMTAKEYEKVLKDREKAWTNEEFKPHKLTEEEIEKRGTHLKMDDFRIIYKILRILQNSMDLEEFDRNSISAEVLGLSTPKWSRIMIMLLDAGYITGAETWYDMRCGCKSVMLSGTELTLKGLEYLEENSLMKKAVNMI